jgi:hypothetical protein
VRYKGLLIVLMLLAVALLKAGAANTVGTGALFFDSETSRGNVFSAGVWHSVTATIDFNPDTLNLKSQGSVVTVYIYIELPPGYDVSQIDISSIKLNGTVPALDWPTEIGDYDGNGIPDLMVKFDRAAVQSVLTVGEQVQITITGEVGGIAFEGQDTIRVIDQ